MSQLLLYQYTPQSPPMPGYWELNTHWQSRHKTQVGPGEVERRHGAEQGEKDVGKPTSPPPCKRVFLTSAVIISTRECVE